MNFPGSIAVPYSPLAGFASGFAPRLVHHTTESASLPHYSGSNPHMTVDVKGRRVYQHQSLDLAAKALRGGDVAGVETNYANATQVEWIGYSSRSLAESINKGDRWVGAWTAADWGFVAAICRKLEALRGIPRRDVCDYQDRAHPMSIGEWRAFSGHCGHQHVPGQDHWDPSSRWRKDLVIGQTTPVSKTAYPGWPLATGDSGPAVKRVQHWLNIMDPEPGVDEDGDFGKRTGWRVRQFQRNHNLDADGIVGPKTWAALRSAAKAKEK